jgi:hypothetical protein
MCRSSAQISLHVTTFIPAGIDELSSTAFIGDRAVVENVVFEPESRVHIILANTFASFKFLRTLLIPASVQMIGASCFANLELLRRVKFDAGSTLQLLETKAFFKCVRGPNERQQRLDTFLKDCQRCVTDGQPFWPDYKSIRKDEVGFIDSSGSGESICIPSSVETVDQLCFAYTTAFSAIVFNPNSEL